MKIAEQLVAFQAKRASAIESAEALMSKAADEGRTLDEHESEQYDGFQAEVKAVDAHIERLKQHEAVMVAKATQVTVDTGRAEGGVEIKGTGPISVKSRVEKGTAFVRYVMATAKAKGNVMHAAEMAKGWRDSTPEVEAILRANVSGVSMADLVVHKTAVAAGTSTDSGWAGPLVYAQQMVSEFAEYLRPATILGRMNQVRRVPFNVRIPRQTAGATASFVGENAAMPVSKPTFDYITHAYFKMGVIVVLTEELVRLSDPSAEALVRSDIVKAVSQAKDKRFIDPSYAAVANTSPASISNGVTSRQASGTTLAAIDDDVAYVFTQMTNAELDFGSMVWVMPPATAITLSLMRNSQGYRAFPEISAQGGTWYGLPVITSNNVASSGSSGENQIFLIEQSEILLSDDGQMTVDMSTEASLQLNDAPSSSASSLISLWQSGLLGVKIDSWVNWTKRRSAAVQQIEYANRYDS